MRSNRGIKVGRAAGRTMMLAACLCVSATSLANASMIDDLLPPLLPLPSSGPVGGIPEPLASIEVFVKERKKRFSPSVIYAPSGTVKFTVHVPKSAKTNHGVGIDGGAYQDVEGGSVKPGHTTSLTLDLEPGRYVLFDSYRDNRRKGFRSKVIVTAPTS